MPGRGAETAWVVGTTVFGLVGVVLGVGLTVGGGAVLLGWRAPLAHVLPWLPEIAAVATLQAVTAVLIGPPVAVAGLLTASPRPRGGPFAPMLALGGGVAIFLAGVFHPLESTGQGQAEFYAEVERRIGGARLATYGGMDYAPNWSMRRPVVKNVRTVERVERLAMKASEPLWLVAEEREVLELGLPARTEIVFRYPRPLGPTLVLLRNPGAPAEPDR